MAANFVVPKTCYSELHRAVGCNTPEEFYAANKRDDLIVTLLRDIFGEITKDAEVRYSQIMYLLAKEAALYAAGRPYYKIYPEYVAPLIATNLNIPCKHFRLPFLCWEIRLPIGSMAAPADVSGDYIVSLLVANAADVLVAEAAETESNMDVHAIMRASFDYTAPYVITVQTTTERGGFAELTASMDLMSDTLEDGVTRLCARIAKEREQPPHDTADEAFVQKIFRLVAATTCLITGNDRIIQPDVLSKDLDRLASAKDAETIATLHDKATRRRHEGKGYTIGRRERLLDLARARHAEVGEEPGRSLYYQHQRCGHFHRFKTSKGYITKWIPQLTVRPDLPLSPSTRAGVQIKKT